MRPWYIKGYCREAYVQFYTLESMSCDHPAVDDDKEAVSRSLQLSDGVIAASASIQLSRRCSRFDACDSIFAVVATHQTVLGIGPVGTALGPDKPAGMKAKLRQVDQRM